MVVTLIIVIFRITVLLGSSVVTDSQFLYCFAAIKPLAANHYTALTRLSLEHLKQGAVNVSLGQWKFLDKEGNWLAWENASLLLDNSKRHPEYFRFSLTPTPNSAVSCHPHEECWIAVIPAASFMKGRALYSKALALVGPLSEPETLYRYPEMEPCQVGYSRNISCYVAKEHPDLESASELMFTYVCNSFLEEELMNNVRICRPISVRVSML
ncbi:hypothetical protein Ddc_15558 [Ditylenchus destructor]|nr:hypothetical protein Ddc_15558 [Ditylenchus destructor]